MNSDPAAAHVSLYFFWRNTCKYPSIITNKFFQYNFHIDCRFLHSLVRREDLFIYILYKANEKGVLWWAQLNNLNCFVRNI